MRVKMHSVVDVITNSSTVIYVTPSDGAVESTKALLREVLNGFGLEGIEIEDYFDIYLGPDGEWLDNHKQFGSPLAKTHFVYPGYDYENDCYEEYGEELAEWLNDNCTLRTYNEEEEQIIYTVPNEKLHDFIMAWWTKIPHGTRDRTQESLYIVPRRNKTLNFSTLMRDLFDIRAEYNS